MTTSTENSAPKGSIIRVAGLANRDKNDFSITPDTATCKHLAAELGLLGISKLRFEGHLRPFGKSDWAVEAKLGASVQQPCVITLDPVTSRIDVEVRRQFLRQMPEIGDEDEREMVEDENIEPLGDTIDLWAVLTEALALNLPAYPKKAGANLEKTDFAADGIEPLSDETVKPFAGLAALRDKLKK